MPRRTMWFRYNYSPYAVFDDAVLADGTAFYAWLALERLAAASSSS